MSVQLTIVTPEGEAFSGHVDTVVLPGSEGDFGVLEGHEQFLSPLRIGAVEIQTSGGTQWAAVSRGFADVGGSEVVVLVDRCDLAAEIDAARVEASRQEAEAELHELSGDPENDVRRGELNDVLERARVQTEVAGRA